ncbi:Thiamine biosynthesis lipoprotein ApbE precursor [Anatilimnocola aggregata]|uniref:FAD:protein FMN transferase n=1 Tax=Anatilimnocola aggregata TaxID=2528021 RepID=A0A517YN06_9BACT|nr:FAD:protein FMN transferase [Anatilimnocola aggregata]QDU31610.1 Thiamine biosynthesis lipoprotein ApbE precursor [Anatilimnocola aggregata]
MSPPNDKSSRRDFLAGRSAREVLVKLAAETKPAPKQVAAAPVEQRPARPLLHVSREAMACEFEIFFDPVRYPSGTDVSVVALDLITALEDQLTIYRETSEVSRLNAIASFRPVAVEIGLFELLQRAKELSQQTGGAFDVTAGQLSKTWGFFRREGRFPTPAEIAEALALVGSDSLELNAAGQSVQFMKPGMELNFGAIGKGYALDRAADLLAEKGLCDCMLHGGNSSVLARGSREEGADHWTVALKHPLKPNERLGEFFLRNQALGTSGSGSQYFHHAGKRYGHIIDPRTGWPAEAVLSSTVIAPTAAEADALATALYVMSLSEAEAFAKVRPDVAVLLITHGKHPGAIELHPFNLPADAWRNVG